VEWVLKVNWTEKFLFIKLRFPMEWVLKVSCQAYLL
jgi:hypothetical protein